MHDDYLAKVARYREQNPQQREGQAHFNALARFHRDVAERIWGTEVDPFFDDNRMPAFHKAVSGLMDVRHGRPA